MAFPSNIAGLFSGAGGSEVTGNSLIRMGVDYSGIRGQARAAVNDFSSGMRDGARGIQEQSRVWSTAFAGLRVAAFGAFTGAAAAAGIGASAAISYESAFAGVIKTVDAAPEVIERLRGRFRELATEIPISAVEFARLGEAAGALGVHADDIEEFARVTALIGVTTDVSSDQAATSLGQLSNVLELTREDYERFGSTLVDLGNKGASTESQILEIASRSGAAGRLIGLTTPQILAFASSIANLGIEVEAGGSALQFLFTSLTLILNDEEKLARLGETAGMTGEQFKVAFQQDALGAILAFFDGLSRMNAEQQVAVLDELGLAGIRTTRAYLGTAASLDTNLLPALATANEAWEENNALQIEAEKRFETTASQIQLLKNRIGDLFIELGNNLLPAIRGGVEWLATNIPPIASRIAEVWQETFGPAVGRMLQGIVDLGGAIVGIFTGLFDLFTGGSSQSTTDFWETLGGLLAVAADWVGKITGGLAAIINDEFVGTLLRFAAAWALVRIAFDGIQRSSRWLGNLGPRTLGFLSGGLVGGGGAGGRGGVGAAAREAAEAGGADDALQIAARELRTAAAALSSAAATLSGAGVLDAGGTPRLTSLPGGAGAAGAGAIPIPRGAALPGSAAGAAAQAGRRIWEQSAYAVASSAAQASTARGLAGQAARDAAGAGRSLLGALGTALLAPFRAAGAVGSSIASSGGAALLGSAARDAAGAGRALASGIANGVVGGVSGAASLGARGLGLAGSALSAVSRVFWPSMVGLLVADLVKAPIGSFVAEALNKPNLGAEIQRDLFSGIGTWFTSVLEGVDVESIANLGATEFTFGGVSITRADAAKAGFTRGTMEKLFAEEMTLEGLVIGQAEVQSLLGTPAEIPGGLVAGTPEHLETAGDVLAQAERLGIDVAALYQEEFGAGWVRAMTTTPSPEMIARIRAEILKVLPNVRDQFAEDWDTQLRQPVEQALVEMFGATPEQLAFIGDNEIEQLAVLLTRNSTGQYDAYIKLLLGRTGEAMAGHIPAIPELPATVAAENPEVLQSQRFTSAQESVEVVKRQVEDALTFADLLATDLGAQLARDAALLFISQYGDQIEAADTTEAQAALAEKLGVPWEELVATYEQSLRDTGQAHLLTLANTYADIVGDAAAAGIDITKEPFARSIEALLLDALDSGTLTPEAEEQLRQILSTAFADAPDKVPTDVAGRRVIAGMGRGVTSAEPELTEKVRVAVDNALKKFAIDADFIRRRGIAIMQALVDGIGAGPSPGGAMAARLRDLPVPSSPVKWGPLKHPFLPNAGRKIVEQLNEGILGTKLAAPNFGDLTAQLAGASAGEPGAMLRGGDRTQQIHIDRLFANDARDEQSAAARLAFLMPEV